MADEIFYETVVKIEELFKREYFSTEEVAKLLNISKRQVSRLIKKGELVRDKRGVPSWSIYGLLKRGYERIYCE